MFLTLTKKTDLIPNHTERLAATAEQFVKKWIDIGLSIESTNKQQAESGIAALYKEVGLPPPIIVWCGSPAALMITELAVLAQLEAGQNHCNIGKLVQRALFARHYGSISSSMVCSMRTKVTSKLLASVQQLISQPVGNAVRDRVGKLVVDACEKAKDERGPLWTKAASSAAFSARTGLNKLKLLGANLGNKKLNLAPENYDNWIAMMSTTGYGQHDAHWVARYDFLRRECGLKEELKAIAGPASLIQNAGWYVPLEGICFVSERQSFLSYDAQGRLHNDRGPAVVYPDGWSVYAWHGTRIAEHIIERPNRITIAEINAETRNDTVRRLLIEKYGSARFWVESGAQAIHNDETGTLYRLRSGQSEAIYFVRVTNSTPEPDGSYKEYMLPVPPDMTSARNAVAWTFNLHGSEYCPSVQT